jgi:hypothetical protein
MRIFDRLFNGSWPKLSAHALEKCFEKSDLKSAFPLSKSSFGMGKVVVS